jgi:peptidoglycan/LPS O-acetylase OafA/YrhL
MAPKQNPTGTEPYKSDTGLGARIKVLDGWRGLGILLVVTGHLILLRYEGNDLAAARSVATILGKWITVVGTWSIDIFFMISGFVITRLALEEVSQTGRFSVRGFYTRRILRVFPPFYLYLVCLLAMSWFGLITQPYSDTLRAAVFTCDLPYTTMDCGWFAGHAWSLSVEEQFYLAFPLLFALGYRQMRKALPAILAVLILAPFVRALLHLGGPFMAIGFVAPKFIFICLGVTAGAHESSLQHLAQSSAGAAISWIAAGLLLILFCLDVTLLSPPLGTALAYLNALLNETVLSLSLAWLLFSSVYRPNLLARALNGALPQYLGAMSYSLYLWQQLFTSDKSHYPVNSWLLYFPLMFVPAWLSYRYIERPSRRLVRKLANRRPIVVSDMERPQIP